MERIVARLAKADDALARLMDARRRTVAAWRRLERRLVGAQAGFGRVAPEVMRNGFTELRAIERKLDRLETTLRERFPGVATLLSLAPVSMDEARRLLGANEALVTTLSGPRLTHVWVVTRKASHYHRAALGADQIAAMVERLRASLDPRRGADADDADPFPLELSATLYRHLLAPARAVLDGVSHVFHAPDGALRNLPLSVLVVDLARAPPGAEPESEPVAPPESGFARYRDVVWFIDKHAYSRIPSLNALRALRSKPAPSRAPEGLVGIGDIAGLDLDADLVVLGAAPSDGKAGARSLMAAHWPVEPEAATAFTAAMVAKRDDGGPQGLARLLQRSALEILNDETRGARFAHPMYWGAFTIIGDGGRRY